MSTSARRWRDDRGSVAAEFAVTLPSVILVLAACVGGMQIAGQQLRLQDAAAAAARSLGRGDDAAATAATLAPGSTLATSSDGEIVCATLSQASRGSGLALFGFPLSARGCSLGDGG